MIDNEEVQLIADEIERRLLKKIYNMFYSWSMFMESEDGVTPSFEEAIKD